MFTTTLRLPEELHAALKAEAKNKGMTFNGYVLSILWKAPGYDLIVPDKDIGEQGNNVVLAGANASGPVGSGEEGRNCSIIK